MPPGAPMPPGAMPPPIIPLPRVPGAGGSKFGLGSVKFRLIGGSLTTTGKSMPISCMVKMAGTSSLGPTCTVAAVPSCASSSCS